MLYIQKEFTMRKFLTVLVLLLIHTTPAFSADIEALTLKAENGDTEAMYNLVNAYRKEKAENWVEQSEHWLLRAAEHGHAQAQFEMGGNLDNRAGNQKPELFAKALVWYEKAAAQGHARTLLKLAYAYESGRHRFIPKDMPKAFSYYLALAQLTDVDPNQMWLVARGQDMVGEMYYRGIPGERDFDKAYEWLMLAAENGQGGARYFLDQHYVNGKVKRNPDDVIILAEQGDACAQLKLIWIYLSGHEMKDGIDMAQAEKWYYTAANRKVANASHAYLIGLMCHFENAPDAHKWYTIAAELGNTAAKYELAEILADLDNSDLYNPSEAFGWYLQAAREGYGEAYDKISNMYATGEGVAKNRAKALVWHMQAARYDSNYKLFSQAELYRNGYNPATDIIYLRSLQLLATMTDMDNVTESRSWQDAWSVVRKPYIMKDYAKTLERLHYLAGSPVFADIAQMLLGDMHLTGEGVSPDAVKAFEWYQQSADSGFYAAQLQLAQMYKTGKGTQQDYVKAYVWAVTAFFNPNADFDPYDPCPAVLLELPDLMSPEQFQAAADILQQQGLKPPVFD